MQIEKPKIELYRVRTFSDKLTDTFNFLRENWRILTKYFVGLMLPICILVSIPYNHFLDYYTKMAMIVDGSGAYDNSDLIWLLISLGGFLIGSILIYMLPQAMIYSMMRLYEKRSNGLSALVFSEFKNEFFHCLLRSFIFFLFSGLTAFVCAIFFILVFVALNTFGLGYAVMRTIAILLVLFFATFFIFVVYPLYMLFLSIYMMEDETGLVGSFKKVFHLGVETWLGTLLLLLVVLVIGYILNIFSAIPLYIVVILKTVLTLSNELNSSFVSSSVFSFIQFLTCVFYLFITIIPSSLMYVGVTIQYGHASEKIDGRGVAKRIEKFDEFDNF